MSWSKKSIENYIQMANLAIFLARSASSAEKKNFWTKEAERYIWNANELVKLECIP